MLACESSNGVFFCATRFVRCPEEAVASNAVQRGIFWVAKVYKLNSAKVSEGFPGACAASATSRRSILLNLVDMHKNIGAAIIRQD
jgi:hypothetical protein